MEFGETIRRLRKEKKLTQAELGKKAGLSSRIIQRYESGNVRPRMDAAEKIAKALECPIYELLGHDGMLVAEAAEKGGAKSSRNVQSLIEEVTGLFAGGTLPEEEKDALMSAFSAAYFESKKENQKYTPKKYRKD